MHEKKRIGMPGWYTTRRQPVALHGDEGALLINQRSIASRPSQKERGKVVGMTMMSAWP